MTPQETTLPNNEERERQRDLKTKRALSPEQQTDLKETPANQPGDSFISRQDTRPTFRSPLAAEEIQNNAYGISAGQQSIDRKNAYAPSRPLQIRDNTRSAPTANTRPYSDIQTSLSRLREQREMRTEAAGEEQNAQMEGIGKTNTPTQKTTNQIEENYWKYVWFGIMGTLTGAFFAGFFTIVIPLILLPIISFLYGFRLIAVNFLNKGKSITFPILGISSVKVAPLQFPFEVMIALLWIVVGFFVMIGIFLAIIYMMNMISSICTGLDFLCKLIPAVQVPLQ